MQLAIAFLVVTFPARLVIEIFLGLSDSEVAHIVLTAGLANFEISITMELVDFIGGDATLAMQTIDVLCDDCFE